LSRKPDISNPKKILSTWSFHQTYKTLFCEQIKATPINHKIGTLSWYTPCRLRYTPCRLPTTTLSKVAPWSKIGCPRRSSLGLSVCESILCTCQIKTSMDFFCSLRNWILCTRWAPKVVLHPSQRTTSATEIECLATYDFVCRLGSRRGEFIPGGINVFTTWFLSRNPKKLPTPNGGGGKFVTSNTEKAYQLCDFQHRKSIKIRLKFTQQTENRRLCPTGTK